jgi:hypothetical protein
MKTEQKSTISRATYHLWRIEGPRRICHNFPTRGMVFFCSIFWWRFAEKSINGGPSLQNG